MVRTVEIILAGIWLIVLVVSTAIFVPFLVIGGLVKVLVSVLPIKIMKS